MIKSMTGFGSGEASSRGITISVEVRSVNSRYLDISSRLPPSIQDRELTLKELVQQHIDRGKLNVSVRIDQHETGNPDITFNEELARGYKELLEDLREATGIDEPVTLHNLLTFNNLFESREQDEETIELIWELTRQATDKALEQLVRMRIQEGDQLARDFRERIANIENLLDNITALSKDRAQEARDRLTERIRNLIDDDTLDPDRLEMEVAMLADKMDITEEVVRLASHLKFFREALEKEEPVGRRLNFLSQEINREINTIGSKANSSEISHYVVQVKESLEQIKEQIQNVE